MRHEVTVIRAGSDEFVEIQPAVRLAILLPTARSTPMARSVLGSMVGFADEEVAVLISDDSASIEKREFLRNLPEINPHVVVVSHEKNRGAHANFYYLYEWCRNVEFCAQMADDDWVSPTYHVDAYKTLLNNPGASFAEAGTTLMDQGEGRLVQISQPTAIGRTPIERMRQWDCAGARATMYNVSRRACLEPALRYAKTTPISGATLMENLWDLCRLAQGDFLRETGPGCFIHYPAHTSGDGDPWKRFFNLFCRDNGLRFPFLYFAALSTAVQCALFLMGKLSPITCPAQRTACGQHVFAQIYKRAFMPNMLSKQNQVAASEILAAHPGALGGFRKYCNPPFSEQPVFSRSVFEWFISMIEALEEVPTDGASRTSERFREFAASLSVDFGQQ